MARVYRFSFQGHTASGTLLINSLHYQTDVAPTGSEPAASDVLAAIDAHLRTAYRAVVPSSFTIDSAELRECLASGDTNVPVAASLVINQPGTLTTSDTSLPYGMTCIVKLRSDAGIRSGRGYLALPDPLSSTFLASRLWGSSYFPLVQSFAALLDDTMSLGSTLPTTLNPVVYSRTRHNRGESPFTFQMVEAIPRSTPSWRRSRMTVP